MANVILNGLGEVRVQNTSNGVIYTTNYRSLAQECKNLGTDDCRLNQKRHAFFLGGNSYYVGPSLQNKDFNGLKAVAPNVQVHDSITKESYEAQVAANAQRVANGEVPEPIHTVPCLFLPQEGEGGSLGLM